MTKKTIFAMVALCLGVFRTEGMNLAQERKEIPDIDVKIVCDGVECEKSIKITKGGSLDDVILAFGNAISGLDKDSCSLKFPQHL